MEKGTHKVSITSDEEGRTRLILDDLDVTDQCFRFSLNQVGGEAPELTVELRYHDVDVRADAVKLEGAKSYS